VAQFDGEEVDWAYDSEDLEKADFTIEEGDEDDGCDQSPVLGECGKGLMTMGCACVCVRVCICVCVRVCILRVRR